MLRRLFMAGAMAIPSAMFMAADDKQTKPYVRNAICILYPHNPTESNTKGIVSFSQDDITSAVKIVATVYGLKPNQNHGIHIHQYGDLTEGCASAGPHFNPHGKRHGGLESAERHVGDLGNITANFEGKGYLCIKTQGISLFGEHSVIGRSVVVHGNEDDEGRGNNEESAKTGNSGPRLACGVIALSSTFKNIYP